MNGYMNLPLRRIATWAFLLNAIWEFGQCTMLYDMWGWGLLRGAAWMWAAILGDVVIVLGVVWVSCHVAGDNHMNPPDGRGTTVLISISGIASIALEWLARYVQLWEYSALMPTIEVLGFSVGLSPILQITVLPPLCVFLTFNHTVTGLGGRRL